MRSSVMTAFHRTGFRRGHVLQTHAGSDVAGADFFNFFTVVGVHLHDTTDTLFLAAHRVVNRGVALLQHAGIHAHEGQLSHERVGHQLECQAEIFVVVGLAGHFLFIFVRNP